MMRHKKIIIAVMALFICLLGGRIVAQLEGGDFSKKVTYEGSHNVIQTAEAQVVAPEVTPATVQVPVSTPRATPQERPRPSVQADPRPRALSIPSIGLSREIIDVGIADDGKLDVPPNYTQVGWYKYGTLPGKVGSAVLDGHVDNGGAIDGPFKRLREVKIGDEIIVTAADGTRQKFKVIASKVYPTTQFPGELVFHDKSGALLKIITCHGNFIPRLDTYDQRLIVTAELVK
jgi:sortase (surface protein transpeptidase)